MTWAFKKGHRYGTILVDLERHRLVDLLPDRSAESVAAWLKQHPEVEVVSRDRAAVYADGARQGASQAQQVADRWHLLHNLGEAMQRLTAQHAPQLRQIAEELAPVIREASAGKGADPVRLPHAAQRRQERCTIRETLYQRVQALRQQGLSVPAIVAHVDVSKRTVQRFLCAEQLPQRSRRRRQPRQTDRYVAYLRQRVEAGCRNATQLYREIKAQDFAGSYSSLYNAVQRMTTSGSEDAEMKVRSSSRVGVEVPSSRSVAW